MYGGGDIAQHPQLLTGLGDLQLHPDPVTQQHCTAVFGRLESGVVGLRLQLIQPGQHLVPQLGAGAVPRR